MLCLRGGGGQNGNYILAWTNTNLLVSDSAPSWLITIQKMAPAASALLSSVVGEGRRVGGWGRGSYDAGRSAGLGGLQEAARLRRGGLCAAVDTGGCRRRRASARRRSAGCSRSTAAPCAPPPAPGDSQRKSADRAERQKTDGKEERLNPGSNPGFNQENTSNRS